MRILTAASVAVLAVACAKKSDVAQQSTNADTTLASTSAASGTETAIKPTETAVAPEVNPPGDIPDSQQFVSYANSGGGYKLEIPEGWARTETGGSASFVNKFDGVKVDVAPSASPAAPTATSVRANEAKAIQASGKAVTITSVSDVSLPGGKAVVVKYTSNSEANPVTNKQVRLENETYVFSKNGKEAMLTVWAPQGADNVDQWQRMAKSFRWQ
ncbi:MAG TPA: hypothetical protein VGN73_14645 [Gemmatimonadaceae bacterium]|jgi:hypothetical protein|nr:hypothetical protein [Gemmatimonadaceae bacterium]